MAGRLDLKMSKLQALGFEVCTGTPCFKGVTIGTDWTTVQQLFPDGATDHDYLQVASNLDAAHPILIKPSWGDKTVESISLGSGRADQPLPIDAQDVITQYGAPKRVYLDYSSGAPIMVIVYPMMTVRLDLRMKNSDDANNYMLQWTSPVIQLSIVVPDVTAGYAPGTCCNQTWIDSGPWHGFIPIDLYRRYNFRDLGYSDTH